MGDRQRMALFLVGCAGALISHAAAYLVVAGDVFAGDAHGHVGLATALVVPVAAIALGWMAIGAARRVDLGEVVSVRHLVAVQTAVFLWQEGMELASIGSSFASAFTNPAIALGLAIQPLVAAGLVFLLRLAVRFVASLLPTEPRCPSGRPAPLSAPSHLLVSLGVPLGAPTSRRGPPAEFVIS